MKGKRRILSVSGNALCGPRAGSPHVEVRSIVDIPAVTEERGQLGVKADMRTLRPIDVFQGLAEGFQTPLLLAACQAPSFAPLLPSPSPPSPLSSIQTSPNSLELA